MKNIRIIQKGNVSLGSFDVRIIESDGKTYYYHFLELVDGQQAIESQKPINLKGVEDILWDNLPFTVKELHCKKAFPNYNLNDYETRCLLFGKEQTDQALAEERKKEEKRDLFESQKSIELLSPLLVINISFCFRFNISPTQPSCCNDVITP